MHIPDDPLFYEKFYFTPGDLGFSAWDTKFARIGVLRVLGPMVSGSRPAHGIARRADSFLSDRHRLASKGKGRIWQCASILRGKPCSAATP